VNWAKTQVTWQKKDILKIIIEIVAIIVAICDLVIDGSNISVKSQTNMFDAGNFTPAGTEDSHIPPDLSINKIRDDCFEVTLKQGESKAVSVEENLEIIISLVSINSQGKPLDHTVSANIVPRPSFHCWVNRCVF
jgi:hypothetical protein